MDSRLRGNDIGGEEWEWHRGYGNDPVKQGFKR